MIVTHDPIHFFSVPGRAPGATYCVLRYRPSLTTTQFIKVDILLPGTLHLPALHPSHIACISGFPVIPFALLLLQKLQAYDDHWNAQERHHFVRWKKDRDDVQALMGLHDIVGQTIRELPWGDATVFSDEFLALSVQRVAKFAGRFEWSRATWKALGFKV
ncbi:uncharacterized protein SCHCODRAFT_073882 [Schizophyllum commune H4-8]|uniref:Expressed protein n=1 Tax=Schizophyllum commune (strain H4-8 / FGSC 9210) TaxID=578458 RepID=D8PTX3_SCHCM|nr:uncharacterized protein SCHCODRAFT_073882 [Schizophyllum commune H4-8]KAI5900804.1 hypothetical protein SCHCODRAFT_073882 [Schizophyllum commune H4-8]